MSDRQALLNAILENPDDDAPRLIMADWLDEHNEPERAEFIRLQIELATYPRTGLDRDAPVDMFGQRERRFLKWGKSRKRLHKREREFLTELGNWRKFAPDFPLIMSRCHPSFDGHAHVSFSRGFISSISCTAADCLAHLDKIIAEHPVREVTLTTPLYAMRRNDWEPPFYLTTYATPARYPYQMPESIRGWEKLREVKGRLPDKWEEMNFIESCLNAEWPRIKFHLPPTRQLEYAQEDFRSFVLRGVVPEVI